MNRRLPPEALPSSETSPALIAEGQKVFRAETFGDEKLWTDTLKLNEVVEKSVDPTTALKVGLKVDADVLPPGILGKVDLKSPATTVALLKMNAVVGLQATVDANNHITQLGVTCALCHSTVDNSSQIALHEGDEPDPVAHLRHPDILPREDLTEIHLVALETDPPAMGHGEGRVVERVRQLLLCVARRLQRAPAPRRAGPSADLYEIHLEHSPANPGSFDPASSSSGPQVGLLSERRLVYLLTGVPKNYDD